MGLSAASRVASGIGAEFGAVVFLAAAGRVRLLAWRPLVYLGSISYALYLWHFPLLVLVAPGRNWPSPGVASVVVVASIAVAALSTRYVERPFRQPRRRQFATANSTAMKDELAAGGVGLTASVDVTPTVAAQGIAPLSPWTVPGLSARVPSAATAGRADGASTAQASD